MTYYERAPGYQLDQTDTQRAVDYFLLFLNRHPNSEYRQEAEAKIAELREKMARKQYETAGLYERREIFEAAALSYESVFDQYPETAWADDALLGAIRMYIAFAEQSIEERQEERLQRAVQNYERLVQIFPDSPHLAEAESLYEEATAQLEALAAAD